MNNKTLNFLIFKEVSINLAYESTLDEIREYSLLSKGSFKIFQNIITYNYDQTKIVIDFESFIDYLYDIHDTSPLSIKMYMEYGYNKIPELDEKRYQNSLLQFKNAEFLIFKIKDPLNVSDLKLINYQEGYKNYDENIEKIIYRDNYFKQLNCKSLKRIHFIEPIKIIKSSDNQFIQQPSSSSQGTLTTTTSTTEYLKYTYEKLEYFWDFENLPISDSKEYNYMLNNSELGLFNYSKNKWNINKIKEYDFSFNKISIYKPNKLIITNYSDDNDFEFNYTSLITLPQHNQLKSITIKFNFSTSNFIKQVLSTNFIESLSTSFDVTENGEVGKNDETIKKRRIDRFKDTFSNLSNNTSLKKLLIRNYEQHEGTSIDYLDVFFKDCLNGNTTLLKIGLEYFNILTIDQLNALSTEFKSINTLYLNLNQLLIVGKHCNNENSNIISLKVNLVEYLVIEQTYLDIITDFLNSNTSKSLKNIKFTYHVNDDSIQIIDSITNLFKKINKNNIKFNFKKEC